MERETDYRESEMEELFGLLGAAGYNPQLATDNIPHYGNRVPAGTPAECDQPYTDNDVYCIPQSVTNSHFRFSMDVKGDSMKDFGIEDGDRVTIEARQVPTNGDVILASIDGEITLKAYHEDEYGNKWLVPYNPNFEPILLREEMLFRCHGVVVEVIKQRLKTDYRDLERTVRRFRQSMATRKRPTAQQQEQAIIGVAPWVEEGRKWYSVYRAMVDAECDLVVKGDYMGFCQLVARLVPDHKRLPKAQELQRMCVKSFARAVRLWDENDAPVGRTRFMAYKKLAQKTDEMLRVA